MTCLFDISHHGLDLLNAIILLSLDEILNHVAYSATSAYNNIHHPSKLVVGADFHCFKHKIEPKWEDPVCANGGAWKMNFSKGKSDTSWLYTVCGRYFHPALNDRSL